MKLAVRYGKGADVEARASWAKAWSAGRRCTRSRCSSPTSRRIRATSTSVDDARSELVIPMLIKDRCIGVFDLESPELDAFTKEHKELLTLLASQAAVAIDNARLYEEVRRNEERIEKELRFAQRVQVALLPTELPKPLRRRRRRRPLRAGARARRRPPRLPRCPSRTRSSSPSATCRARARRRRSTARSPPSWCARGRCGAASRRTASASSGVLQAMNTILHERQLEEYYCTLCYAFFDFERRTLTMSNSGLPYPIRCSGDDVRADRAAGRAARIVSRRHLRRGRRSRCSRTTCSCSARTASSRALNEQGDEFGARRAVRDRAARTAHESARDDRRRDLRRGHRVPRRARRRTTT